MEAQDGPSFRWEGARDLAQHNWGVDMRHHKGAGREAERETRAQRVLDATAALIMRYGYRQTTINDIARESGIGKGTLYLHWKSRDELFAALIMREKIAMAEDIQRRITSDPEGASLRGLLKQAALALMHRPLLKAVLLRDTEAYGMLAQREQGGVTSTEVLAGFTTYLQVLREQGLVRTDLPLRTLGALFGSIFLGFFLATPLLPDAFALADEELAELMAEAGHRALEPRDPVPLGAYHTAAQTLTQHMDRSIAKAQDRMHGDVSGKLATTPVNSHSTTRARGTKGGRSKKLKTSAEVAEAQRLYADKTRSIEDICAALGISRASLYRYLKEAQATVS
jgi:AcrR family transcriptional regulator